jgi:Flp pilus assembly pilin Flp
MKISFKTILNNDVAATAIEYCLLASILAIGAIVSFEALGVNVEGLFVTVDSAYENREETN